MTSSAAAWHPGAWTTPMSHAASSQEVATEWSTAPLSAANVRPLHPDVLEP